MNLSAQLPTQIHTSIFFKSSFHHTKIDFVTFCILIYPHDETRIKVRMFMYFIEAHHAIDAQDFFLSIFKFLQSINRPVSSVAAKLSCQFSCPIWSGFQCKTRC